MNYLKIIYMLILFRISISDLICQKGPILSSKKISVGTEKVMILIFWEFEKKNKKQRE